MSGDNTPGSDLKACLRYVRSNEKLEDDEAPPPAAGPQKPAVRTPVRPENLQKWVQCARCSQWRKVRALWPSWATKTMPIARLLALGGSRCR